jgi:ketosteroid isomerase-like protein
MGAAEDVALVRRGYEAFNTGDMDTLTELFEQSASWHTPGRGSLAGDHQGRDATFAYFGQLGGQTGGTFRAELQHLAGDGDGCVIALHHNSGERGSKHLDVDCCIVFESRMAG